jgi:SAM domain (Sterile alpha motif)
VDIAAWLRELGLERYEEAFRENEIDAQILPKLTADDLKDIGVTTVGHRRKLLEAIAELAEPALAPQAEPIAPAETAPRERPAEAERRQLCFAISLARRAFRLALTLRTCATLSQSTARALPMRWRDLTGSLPSTWAMASSSISVIPKHTRMMRSGRSRQVWPLLPRSTGSRLGPPPS